VCVCVVSLGGKGLSVKVKSYPVEFFFFFDSRSGRRVVLSATWPQLLWVMATFLSTNTRVCHPMVRLLVLKFAHPAPTSAQVKRECSCTFTSSIRHHDAYSVLHIMPWPYGIPSCTELWHHSKFKHSLLSIKSAIFRGLAFFLVFSQTRRRQIYLFAVNNIVTQRQQCSEC
jgi:hypothetical protein